MKKGDLIKDVELYGEICCEVCNEIIHNHIDCPVCHKKYASTDCYGPVYETKTIKCLNCNTVFENTTDSWYIDNELKILKINKEYIDV